MSCVLIIYHDFSTSLERELEEKNSSTYTKSFRGIFKESFACLRRLQSKARKILETILLKSMGLTVSKSNPAVDDSQEMKEEEGKTNIPRVATENNSTAHTSNEQMGSSSIHLFWSQFREEQRGRIMIIRRQTSGLCHVAAPIVLEHYLTAIQTDGAVCTTYDMSLYLSRTLWGQDLEALLLGTYTGRSDRVLAHLCGLNEGDLVPMTIPNKQQSPEDYTSTCEEIYQLVASTPALISRFEAHEEFLEEGVVSFTGEPKGAIVGLHSMVLIGARKASYGKYHFLLQNWWDNKYFIDVSGEYMSACHPSIYFVRQPISRRPELADILRQGTFAETCADAPDRSLEG